MSKYFLDSEDGFLHTTDDSVPQAPEDPQKDEKVEQSQNDIGKKVKHLTGEELLD